MVISRVARVVASSVTVIVGSVLVAACGSPPPEENSGETNEALVRSPICPSWGCGANPLPPAPTCATWPRPLDSDPANAFTNPYVPWRSAECYVNTAFSGEMTKFGCEPEFYYQATANGLVQPVALCPGVPSGTEAITSDSCTGTAPSGWSFVTWSYTNPCQLPGAGCHSGACLTF